jgi:hypothetical protein
MRQNTKFDNIKFLDFFNTDVAIFQRKIKSWKHATKTVEIHLSLSAYNSSAIVAIRVTNTTKRNLKCVIYWYVINFREQLKIHMYTCLSQVLERKNLFFCFNFRTHINYKVSIRLNQGLKFSKHLGSLLLHMIYCVYFWNCCVLNKQVQVTCSVFGTNWNGTGYYEFNTQVGKYR